MAPLFQALQSSTQPCPTRHECGQTLTIDGEFIAVLSVVYPALLLQWRVADACNLLHSYCVAHCLMSHAWGKSKCFRVKYYPVCDSSFWLTPMDLIISGLRQSPRFWFLGSNFNTVPKPWGMVHLIKKMVHYCFNSITHFCGTNVPTNLGQQRRSKVSKWAAPHWWLKANIRSKTTAHRPQKKKLCTFCMVNFWDCVRKSQKSFMERRPGAASVSNCTWPSRCCANLRQWVGS